MFPNAGVRRQAYIIERIDDAEGQVLYRAAHVSTSVMSASLSSEMIGVMRQVLEHAVTAAGARSHGLDETGLPAKTGTTNNYHDAWFVGFTHSLTCGVWVGFDHQQTIQAKGYGAALALPIWVQAMDAAPSSRYPAPDLGAGSVPGSGSTTVTRGVENVPEIF